MNLIIDPNPKDDQHSVNGALAKRLASHLQGPTRTIRLYDSDQRYFNYEFNQDWIELLKESDHLIFPVPMWNYMMPASLKDFFDRTVKRGQLWDLDAEKKYVGLLKNKKAYIIMTSGDLHPAGSEADFLIPYMRYILGFLGIREVFEFRLGGVRNKSLASDQAYMDEKTTEMLKACQLT